MGEMINAPATAFIAYQDLEKALRKEGVWEAMQGLVEDVRDTAYEWGQRDGWDDCASTHPGPE